MQVSPTSFFMPLTLMNGAWCVEKVYTKAKYEFMVTRKYDWNLEIYGYLSPKKIVGFMVSSKHLVAYMCMQLGLKKKWYYLKIWMSFSFAIIKQLFCAFHCPIVQIIWDRDAKSD